MEKNPTPHYHDKCPNCGFELDLSPPERELVAKDIGSTAVKVGGTMTNKERLQKVRDEAIRNADTPESAEFQADVATFVELRKIARANVLIRLIDRARALEA